MSPSCWKKKKIVKLGLLCRDNIRSQVKDNWVRKITYYDLTWLGNELTCYKYDYLQLTFRSLIFESGQGKDPTGKSNCNISSDRVWYHRMLALSQVLCTFLILFLESHVCFMNIVLTINVLTSTFFTLIMFTLIASELRCWSCVDRLVKLVVVKSSWWMHI